MGLLNTFGTILCTAADTVENLNNTAHNNKTYRRSYSNNHSGRFQVITNREI